MVAALCVVVIVIVNPSDENGEGGYIFFMVFTVERVARD